MCDEARLLAGQAYPRSGPGGDVLASFYSRGSDGLSSRLLAKARPSPGPI